MTIIDQLHAIFALPLGQLIIGAACVFFVLAVQLVLEIRTLRRDLELRVLFQNRRMRVVAGRDLEEHEG